MSVMKVSRCRGVEVSRARRAIMLAPSPRRRAFSLVEMVVVIGIIVLLVGLTVAVITSLTRSSENRSAENVLKILDQALQEWELTAERQFTMGADNLPQAGLVYDVQYDYGADPLGTAERQTSIVLTRMFNTQACKDILSKISSEFLVLVDDPAFPPNSGNKIVRVLDPWGKDIVLVHPGRTWTPADGAALGPDDDGTIRTTFALTPDVPEERIGPCVNRRIRFMCAGPDGRFGHLETGSTTTQIEQTKDNLYSYPLEAP